MQNDRQITISAAGDRRATQWPPQTLWWSEMVTRLSTAVRGQETFAEYLRLSKAKQDSLKDVGGFVGGVLTGGRRKNSAVAGRDLVTLDLDALPAMGTDSVLKAIDALGVGYCVYSTRKHEPARPRLRVIMPLHRAVTADEYEPIARKLAEMINIAWCDPTTFQAVRLMYWPSCCADGQHIFYYADKPFLDADGMLGLYADWQDAMAWPQAPTEQKAHLGLLKRQEDPTSKTGVVGAFCRTFNVYQAMEAYLPGVYEPVDTGDGRYTFAGGSTTGGAVVYDNGKFLYSHHATDPCGGELVNAFDLVRLHLYGMLDDDAVKDGTPIGKHPSYVAMRKLALENNEVGLLVAKERLLQTAEDFSEVAMPEDENWLLSMERNVSTGRFEKTVNNLVLVLRNDPALRGTVAFDNFSKLHKVQGALPWNQTPARRRWEDADDNALYWYVEHRYKIGMEKGLQKGVDIVARELAYDDVVSYLDGLAWDGVPRLDTLFIDYLNAEDTPYTRAVTRKIFTAAVTRAMTPGAKFDYSVILVGKQGKGKSTLLRLMGKHWFLEDLPPNLEEDKASERIRGCWLAEMGELNGLSKSEVNVAKAFLSRRVDTYRQAYGRHIADYPRRCVIFGSTNEGEFLRDSTGNRRFWPVTLQDAPGRRSVFDDLPGSVDQVWAEAKARWQIGEPLFLPVELEAEAVKQQERYKVGNAKLGMIEEFVNRPLPSNWATRSLSDRRLYWSNDFGQAAKNETVPRVYVSAVELWCECFGADKGRIRQSDTRELNDLLRELGWRPVGPRRDKIYGSQRYFRTPLSIEERMKTHYS